MEPSAYPERPKLTDGRVVEYAYPAHAQILRRMDSTGDREFLEKLCRYRSFFSHANSLRAAQEKTDKINTNNSVLKIIKRTYLHRYLII